MRAASSPRSSGPRPLGALPRPPSSLRAGVPSPCPDGLRTSWMPRTGRRCPPVSFVFPARVSGRFAACAPSTHHRGSLRTPSSCAPTRRPLGWIPGALLLQGRPGGCGREGAPPGWARCLGTSAGRGSPVPPPGLRENVLRARKASSVLGKWRARPLAETLLVQHFFAGHLQGASCALGEPRELAHCDPLAHRAGGLVTNRKQWNSHERLAGLDRDHGPIGRVGRRTGLGMQRMSWFPDG